jgi:Domain of Unknown Function (DUF1206)
LIAGAARIGHAATGIVYILVGALAVAASIDRRRHPSGPADALSDLRSTGFGAVATGIIAGGLIAHAVWQTLRAWRDFDRVGVGVRGLVERALTFAVAVAMIYRGVAPGVLARLNLAHLRGWLRRIASVFARRRLLGVMRYLQYDRDGRWLLEAIALGFIASGVVELIRAWHRIIRT